MNVDVLVIGLGPAGGRAAAVAARAGLSVLAVEKKRQLGVPVQCAEFVPLPMSRLASSEPVRVQTISGMKSFLPSGEVDQTAFPGLMINRDEFDAAIARDAQAVGAQIWLQSRLQTLDAARRVATIVTPEGEQQVHYKLLVAADGPHSAVARQLGLAELQTVNTRQYSVDLLQPFTDTDIWLSDDFPGGYGWLFPKGNKANLGMGSDKRFGEDLKTPLDRLHRVLIESGRVGATIHGRTGGSIPVGGLRQSLVVGDVMFVGDAGGFTHPITGAGISAAVLSGEAAGQAAVDYLQGDRDALQDYQDEMRDQYQDTLQRAVNRRKELLTVWHTPAAQRDDVMRRGWIAFDEYFFEPQQQAVAV